MLKVETHDLDSRVHHTNAGQFPVEEYRRTEHGIYVRRLFHDHPKIHLWEAHILPEMHLQICRYRPHEGNWWCKYYIDIIGAEDRGTELQTKDLILDIALGYSAEIMIIDTEELTQAIRAGTIDQPDITTALTVTHALISDLSRHRNDLDSFLTHNDISLTWHINDAEQLRPG